MAVKSMTQEELDGKKNPVFHATIREQNVRHTRLTIWNRGAHCGSLTVLTEDYDALRQALRGASGATSP